MKKKIYDTPHWQKIPSGNNIQYLYVIHTVISNIWLNVSCSDIVVVHIRVCISCTNIFRNQKLETITRTARGIRISATFSHRSRVSYISCTLCVCGTSIGVSATPRSSSRVTLLWLWLPSIIEGVWGIHFLLRLSLSPCVHIHSTTLLLTYLFWRES